MFSLCSEVSGCLGEFEEFQGSSGGFKRCFRGPQMVSRVFRSFRGRLKVIHGVIRDLWVF